MKRYNGNPCRVCGNIVRFICNDNCVPCTYKSRRKSSKTYDAIRNKMNPWMALLRSASQRARKRKIQYNLDYEWGRNSWTGKCAITGLNFIVTNRTIGGNPFSPTIDKIDPKLGYIKENCRFILFAVNSLKHTGTDDDMKKIISALYESFFQNTSLG